MDNKQNPTAHVMSNYMKPMPPGQLVEGTPAGEWSIAAVKLLVITKENQCPFSMDALPKVFNVLALTSLAY